ncbi:Rec8 like protein-domain-containing protein [Xylariales sp. AK1849]|nr:Rec8 like protein-domain-containing protein [Xylariales sp. AK1849]
MFYSHEILASTQYGVATIWLVATIGHKSGTRRVTRKAIQEVNVKGACEKILEPGAPIALRLQGNLLYGVSRVYQQKCTYLATDAAKVQNHMMTFYRQFQVDQLDPDAGRAKPENLMIMDDPNFLPGRIPEPSVDMFILSQHSNKTSSQMSPHSLQSGGSSSGNEQFPVQLDLRHSSLSDLRASPHALPGLSSAHKPAAMGNDGDVFGEEEMLGPIDDIGLEIDEFGNINESAGPGPAIVQDEYDLPPLPSIEGGLNATQPMNQPQVDEQGDFMMMDEQPLPDAEAFPQRQQEEQLGPFASKERDQHPAPARRQRKRRIIHADEETEISRNVIRDWQSNYLENCATNKPHPVTAAQAKRNAIHHTFGLGIGNVGQNLGIPGMIHPLAVQFSGDSLFTAYTGLEILEKGRGKRVQSATESIEDDDDERRVRPRIEDDEQQQRRGMDMDDNIFDDVQGAHQSPPEIGREAQSVMEDHPSSAMPWNRHSSLMPGSSIRGPGSAQPRRDQPSSPLDKGGSVQDIVRYSDDAAMGGFDEGGYEFGGGGGQHSANSSFDGIPPPALPETPPQNGQNESQYTREALDREGQNFLSFIEEIMRENGERRHDEDFERQHKWIDFDDVFVRSKTDRTTAAQAFYHVLTLVTKGKMFVEQDGTDGTEPFGGIHIGLKVDAGA